jgi:precorrin-2 methylase
MEIRRRATDLIVRNAEDPVEAEILIALISGESSCEALASRLRMPVVVVEDYIRRLVAEGKVQRGPVGPDLWTI